MSVGSSQKMSVRQPADPLSSLDRRALLQQFREHHYVRNISSQDNFWLLLYLAMTLVAKKTMAVKRVQHCFSIVLVYMVAVILVKALSRPVYDRWRRVLVVGLHVVLTAMRALSVLSMASEQAINWRPAVYSSRVSVFGFFLGMLGTTGGLIRNIELLGLQQEFGLHVAVSVLFVALQLPAGLIGFRLGYCNGTFFTVHEVHDAVAAIANTLLDALLGLPATPSETCSSCPGVVVYATVLLYAAVAVPLYGCYCLQQSALRRFMARAQEAVWQQQEQQQHTAAAANAAAAGSSSSSSSSRRAARGSSSRTSTVSAAPQQQQQRQEAAGVTERAPAAAPPRVLRGLTTLEPASNGQTVSLELTLAAANADAADRGSILAAAAVHILMLVCLLLLCWVFSNAVALGLLPRVLSSQQLTRWCPNRPYPPFLIAAEVYDG